MVRIVTDSVADLPGGLAGELGVKIVPAYIHFGAEVCRDGIDLTPEQFYQRLTSSPVFPTTSAAAPGVFTQAYQELSSPDGILSLHISSKLSAIYESALTGSREAGCPVEVVDTQSISMGLGLLAIGAARLAQQGKPLAELVAWVRAAMPRVRLFALLDTLEYLKRGGRIGKAQAFLGSLLHIKPLLSVKDGEVHPLERVRSRTKGVSRICELVRAAAPLEALAVIHSAALAEAQALADELRPLSPEGKVILSQFGPALGAHAGPSALGVALLRREG